MMACDNPLCFYHVLVKYDQAGEIRYVEGFGLTATRNVVPVFTDLPSRRVFCKVCREAVKQAMEANP